MSNAYRICEGDHQKAEDFVNCTVPVYFYRLAQKKIYNDWYTEEMKRKK